MDENFNIKWSGADKDYRDPALLKDSINKITKNPIWQSHLTNANLQTDLPSILGEEISNHISNLKVEDKILYIETSSTAWASQLRMMQSEIIKKIAGSVGNNKITQLKIYGPKSPNWRYGKKHISGRGPRDTYG